MRAVALIAASLCLLAFAACSGSEEYPTDKGDNEYDLPAMSLVEDDVPEGMLQRPDGEFNNEEFASLFQDSDPEAKLRQFEAQGRIRGHVRIFSWENPVQHFGRPLTITAQITLYADENGAAKSLDGTCGLLLEDSVPTEPFVVPSIAGGSVGFRIVEDQDTLGKSVDTNVCFRAGRLVHAVSQTGLEGTDDIALSVRLAQTMKSRLDDVYFGRGDDDEESAADSWVSVALAGGGIAVLLLLGAMVMLMSSGGAPASAPAAADPITSKADEPAE